MKLTLPSGRRVTVRAGAPAPAREGLFADVLALDDALDGATLEELTLADFHVVRAVLTKLGRVAEEEETIGCQNCDAELRLKPCARLETGPWEHGEANDPELDRTGPFGEELAHGLVLRERTVREAMPLFRARTPPDSHPRKRGPLRFTAAIVEALGIERIGERRTPARIARFLGSCDDATFAAIAGAWLDAHYPLRLGADIACPACGARNTIDAPAERELDRGPLASEAPALDLEAFVERAHELAAPLLREHPDVELVVEDGTPAVDEGGEPLLGSYLPPPPADAAVPQRPPTITVYFRTFVAVLRDDDAFDWEDELRETIEHELEHHVFHLEGHDPMDEEERRAIVDDRVRLVGRTEASHRALGAFGGSLVDFLRRAWPLVVLAAIVLAITIAESRCAE